MAYTPNKNRYKTPDIPARTQKNRYSRPRLPQGEVERDGAGAGESAVDGQDRGRNQDRGHRHERVQHYVSPAEQRRQDFGTPPTADLTERVLYQDPMVLVLDKPAGLLVHSGPSGAPNLEAGLDTLRFGAKDRPTLAHRLDRDTAGCIAIARGPKGAKRLGRLFREGLVEKTYWAIVRGGPGADSGRIEAPILKKNSPAGWRMIVDAKGKSAATEWRVLGRSEGYAWLELKPLTGRTHQVRVHAAHMDCPIVGDPQYGAEEDKQEDAPPLHLLARCLTLPLYQARPAVATTAEPPMHMTAHLAACGWVADAN